MGAIYLEMRIPTSHPILLGPLDGLFYRLLFGTQTFRDYFNVRKKIRTWRAREHTHLSWAPRHNTILRIQILDLPLWYHVDNHLLEKLKLIKNNVTTHIKGHNTNATVGTCDFVKHKKGFGSCKHTSWLGHESRPILISSETGIVVNSISYVVLVWPWKGIFWHFNLSLCTRIDMMEKRKQRKKNWKR